MSGLGMVSRPFKVWNRKAMLRRPRSAPVEPIPKWHIVRGDLVAILRGRDAGKTGRVAEVVRHLNRVVVEGRNLVRRHVRAAGGAAGGVVPTPSPIHYSAVNLLDPTLK
jgi:ribosomal protein L24